jgi:conjugal transfer pilus assembly protein TraB
MDKQVKNLLSQLSTTYQVRKKQVTTLSITALIVLLFFWGVYSLLTGSDASGSEDNHHKKYKKDEKNKTETTSLSIADPLSHVDEASLWVERTQNSLAKEQKVTESLQQQLQTLAQTKAAQDQSNKIQSEQVQALQNQVNQLQEKLTHRPAEVERPGASASSVEGAGAGVAGLNEDVLALSDQNTTLQLPETPIKTSDTYVPAGTFVRAALLGGADASAGVTSQGNPMPMLLRILDPGTLPNGHKSHLQGCTATAAVIGDISSERGQIRLERLSCVAPTGEVVDMPVEGTIFGPEGKNGVRGTPLWREGALLKRAFAAGTLSGLATGISQQYTTTATSPLGSTTTVNGADVFKYGAATGARNAMEKIADYNIRRADQYHPVIQISAGTVVDMVFLKGFFLDGGNGEEQEGSRKSKKSNKIKKIEKSKTGMPAFGLSTAPTPTYMNLSANAEQPASLPLSQQQINVLRAKAENPDSL